VYSVGRPFAPAASLPETTEKLRCRRRRLQAATQGAGAGRGAGLTHLRHVV